jgi:hypothetical protein
VLLSDEDFHPIVGAYFQAHSSTAFRALAPPPLCAVLKRQLTFPFWKEKLRLAHLSLQNGIQKIPGEKGKSKGKRPNRNGDGHLTKQLTLITYYYEHQSYHHQW